ncbi:BLUF domain-containing protein [Salinisphaera hydrothermalis]|uniref:BLUF domain-containing protein n=1 Tax=Salinisphaera hydrothermalis TaxID=563188 RepID=UPI00334057B2
MTESLYRLVYFSRNALAGDAEAVRAEIETILECSRRNNAAANVTGALMFNGGCFAQVLEGPYGAIQATLERIQCDARHSGLRVLAFDRRSARGFAHWSMAYVGAAANVDRFADIAKTSAFDPSALDGEAIYDTLKANMADSALA